MLQNSPHIAEPVVEGGAPILPLCDSEAHTVPLCPRRPPTRGRPSQRLTCLSDGTRENERTWHVACWARGGCFSPSTPSSSL